MMTDDYRAGDASASSSPAGWRAAWAAATRRASRSAAPPFSTACWRRCPPQCTRHRPQRQWRSDALRRHRPAGGRRQRAGFRRSARRHSRRARLGGGATRRTSNGCRACRAIARSCRDDLVARLHAARRRWAPASAARLRALRRMAASGGRPVAGGAARGSAPRADGRRPAQDRDLDRAARHRHRRLAGPSRSIRSSTSTRRKMPRRRSGWRQQYAPSA